MPNVVQTEFLIDGVWTDYSSRVRSASPGNGITISRGLIDQQSTITAASSDFAINNRDGVFTNKNPLSPLFGKIPKNTFVRNSVYPSGGFRETVLKVFNPTSVAPALYTLDKASLDIVGDLEARLEITPVSWRPANPVVLCGKWRATGNNRSWVIRLMPTGQLNIRWTTDGTLGTLTDVTSVNPVPENAGRASIRLQIDQDNGSAQRQAVFYYSDTVDGTYTSLGGAANAGIGSIFSGAADVEIGSIGGSGGTGGGGLAFVGDVTYVGRVHYFRLYNSITGANIVAQADLKVRGIGETFWADGLAVPNTWQATDNPYARITSDYLRFVGQLSAMPIEWDSTGRDVWIPVRAQSALALSQTTGQPLYSPLRRHLSRFSNVLAYWPMEAKNGATVVDQAKPAAASQTSEVTFTGSPPTGLAGSAGSATLASANAYLRTAAAGSGTNTGKSSAVFMFKLNGALPGAETTFITLGSTGTISSYSLLIGPTSFRHTFTANDGTVLGTASTLFGTNINPATGWVIMQITQVQEGANIRWYARWTQAGRDSYVTTNIAGLTFAGTSGAFIRTLFDARNDATFSNAQIAHVLLTRDDANLFSGNTWMSQIGTGYIGEMSGRRAMRLAGEEGLTIDVIGNPDDTMPMGAQTTDTVVALLTECAEVDGAVLTDARDATNGLLFVTRRALGDQYGITLTYSASNIFQVPKPTDDLRYLLNDVTVTAPSGTSANYAKPSGPNSVLAPPNGAGRIPGAISRAAQDTVMDQLAQWEVHWRSWDEYRVPNLTLHMNRTQMAGVQFRNYYALDAGGAIALAGLPSFYTNNGARLIAFGYEETFNQSEWIITFNTVALTPYLTRTLSSDFSKAPIMDSADGQSILETSINSTTFTIVVRVIGGVASGRRWWTGANSSAPIDTQIGGERITVTAVTAGAASGADWVQTLTAIRSINNVVKSHTAGAELRLFELTATYISMGA